MIQEVIIEKESLEYYEYLDQKYREIVLFLGRKDGAVDLVKVQMYFDRAVVPSFAVLFPSLFPHVFQKPVHSSFIHLISPLCILFQSGTSIS